jgi:ferrochelatase
VTESSELAVLVTNVGSPSAPTPAAVRSYLRQFLSDPLVVDAPRLPWWLVRNLVILPFRAPRSARLYRKVWSDEGSPLIVTTHRQANALADRLMQNTGRPVPVLVGMRYGSPSLEEALDSADQVDCRRLLVLPLFPQYSRTTVKSTLDAVAEALKRRARSPELRTIEGYATNDLYIRALATSVRESWNQRAPASHLLISFHGIPTRYADQGDPYPEQCRLTAELLAGELELARSNWTLAFQSRFGREEWLKPYTDETLRRFGEQGRDSLDVICPGFAADCLETLEEMAGANRRVYEEAGGSGYRYIPALNDRSEHIAALAELVIERLRGWV